MDGSAHVAGPDPTLAKVQNGASRDARPVIRCRCETAKLAEVGSEGRCGHPTKSLR